jgi:hypothetical protein
MKLDKSKYSSDIFPFIKEENGLFYYQLWNGFGITNKDGCKIIK